MSGAPAFLYGPRVTIESAADWVLALRKHNNDMSQEEFAERVSVELHRTGAGDHEDVARETISNWERGRFRPDFESVLAIIRAFPEASAMLAGQPVRRAAVPALKTKEAREVAHVVDGLPPKIRAYIRDMVYRVIGNRGAKPPPQ